MMTALHLHPIHNSLAARFYPLGRHGRYGLQLMMFDMGMWRKFGDPVFVHRDRLEAPAEGASIVDGELELSFRGEEWIVRYQGGEFGRCKGSAMAIVLEKARIEATGRADGIDLQECPQTLADPIRVPIGRDEDVAERVRG